MMLLRSRVFALAEKHAPDVLKFESMDQLDGLIVELAPELQAIVLSIPTPAENYASKVQRNSLLVGALFVMHLFEHLTALLPLEEPETETETH